MGRRRNKESCEKKPSPREKAILTLHKDHTKYDYRKHEHLKRIAVWAIEADIEQSLAAYYGHLLVSHAEAATKQSSDEKKDTQKRIDLRDLNSCERCGIVIQPFSNCTVRIEKKAAKKSRIRNDSKVSRNNVVYTCHFCSHRNLRSGTNVDHRMKLAKWIDNHNMEVQKTPMQLLGYNIAVGETTPIRLLNNVKRKWDPKKRNEVGSSKIVDN